MIAFGAVTVFVVLIGLAYLLSPLLWLDDDEIPLRSRDEEVP